MSYLPRAKLIEAIEAYLEVPLVSPETIDEIDLREIWRALEGAILMDNSATVHYRMGDYRQARGVIRVAKKEA
jgi:hypothetical protein